MNFLNEADVGIFCYTSPHIPGFRGILKQRYSDFIVNEVDMEGKVVNLTSLEVSPEILEEKPVKLSDQLNRSYDTEIDSFRVLAGDANADLLKGFIDRMGTGTDENSDSIVLSPSSDKSYRTAIHNFFKEKMKFLVTDTVDGPDTSSKCIRLRLITGGNDGSGRKPKKRKDRAGKPYDNRGSDTWPEHLGKFLRFHLCKENKETQEALGLIGKMLGIQPRSFGFAGTKDKRSVSTQRVTVFKQRAGRLAALNERLIGIKVGDFCHVNEGLLLGQLHGNRFTIILRGVVAESRELIETSTNALGNHGFINYFGLQRFGSSSVPTHLIGAALLRGEWKNAVSMILDPREGERDAIASVREYYKKTGDVEGTIRQLPRNLVAERAILQCLKNCPGNYLQALKAIPRTLRMMYVHSYQSFLWNHAASMRVQKHGVDQVVLGDLVYCKGQTSDGETKASYSLSKDDKCDGTDDDNHDIISSAIDLPEGAATSVTVVNKEDLVAGTYSVDDIILPLPGSRVMYPLNDIGEVYHDLAMKDAISLTEGVHNIKEFSITSMTGGYRRVFQKPKDFEWELLTYTDGNIQLAPTDLDRFTKSQPRMKHREDDICNELDKSPTNRCKAQSGGLEIDNKLLGMNKEAASDSGMQQQGGEPLGSCDAQETQIALKLGLTLPASCYATMAIRELLKTSTSVAFHKSLNN